MNTPASLRKPVLAALVVALGAAFLPAQASAADEAQWVPGRLLVQPRAGLPEAEFDKIIKKQGGKQIGKIEGINVRIIQLPPQASEKAVEALLKNNKHLKFAERDMLVKPAAAASDAYYADSWHLHKMGVGTAWDVSRGNAIKIAVLDTGVSPSHADLTGKLVPGWNVFSNNSDTSDVNGHGTAVAGSAAASTNNGAGIAAVAADALIMPVRIADANAYAYWSTVASGLTWAANNGAHVANISYNGVSGSSAVQSAAQYFKNLGGVTVVAAGNSSGLENIAASDTMITVSATDANDVRTSFSSYGAYVDVAAPGINIWTTVMSGGYQRWWGTSMASPLVAGVVGLMKSANRALASAEIEKILFSTAVDLGAPGFDTYYGHGRVNAAAAVQAAAAAVTADTTPPTVAIANPAGGSKVTGLASVDVSAADKVGVVRVDFLVNGKTLASETSSPFTFSWDTTQVADGDVGLTAVAYDAAGNRAQHAVKVVVANTAPAPEPENVATPDTTAPLATFSSPADGARISGTVAISGAATDDVGVASMRLSINGSVVASASGSAISYRLNTRKYAKGTYTLLLEAVDASGNVGVRSIKVMI